MDKTLVTVARRELMEHDRQLHGVTV
jgi:hypothetical protein